LSLELAGIFLTDADQAALLLVAGGSPEWLRRGQLIEGWRIEAIEQDRVQLSKGGRQQVLQLRADIAAPSTPPPARQPPGDDDATAAAEPAESADQDEATQD
jgi:type II secretory pathway component PulC